RTDPRQQEYYWLAGTFRPMETAEDADVAMVSKGYVSITPVQYDLTAYQTLDELRAWDLKP
ncbi:MAG TPA: 5'/3'-nucleotidase SurE, partial [Candidatus Limnocylindria bacterium]|nr:5'/3'-nucleotidase SurE [Candidatus Limnocylindria bacterium]